MWAIYCCLACRHRSITSSILINLKAEIRLQHSCIRFLAIVKFSTICMPALHFQSMPSSDVARNLCLVGLKPHALNYLPSLPLTLPSYTLQFPPFPSPSPPLRSLYRFPFLPSFPSLFLFLTGIRPGITSGKIFEFTHSFRPLIFSAVCMDSKIN